MIAVKILGIRVRGGIIIDGISKQVTEAGRVGVVMMIVARLVCEGGVEGDALVDEGVTIPDVVAINIRDPIP